MSTRKTQNARELIKDKLLRAKSIVQCVAAAMDSESQAPRPDEPSWAMETAADLINQVESDCNVDDPDAYVFINQAMAVTTAAIAAHDTRESHCRYIELFHVLSAVAALLDKACRKLDRPKSRTPRTTKPSTEKPTLRVVPTVEEART